MGPCGHRLGTCRLYNNLRQVAFAAVNDPLAHIVTAKYRQHAEENGLHFTVAETGWAKASWGRLCGQWLVGSAVMVFDFDNFEPKQLCTVINRYLSGLERFAQLFKGSYLSNYSWEGKHPGIVDRGPSLWNRCMICIPKYCSYAVKPLQSACVFPV